MSYLTKRGSTYYFRRVIPQELQPVMGRREFMLSLRTKDREDAKRLVPAPIVDHRAGIAAGRGDPDAGGALCPCHRSSQRGEHSVSFG